jgi:hypothetical protein
MAQSQVFGFEDLGNFSPAVAFCLGVRTAESCLENLHFTSDRKSDTNCSSKIRVERRPIHTDEYAVSVKCLPFQNRNVAEDYPLQ